MKTFYILIFLFCGLVLNAQFINNSANVWYFGDRAGIDFNSGVPVALTDGQISTQEGVATICDTTGNFLFYTDGTTVWDRNHDPMPNGNGTLHGHWSSTQSAIIVPNLGNLNLYYIFTVDELGGSNGLQYSLVNMLLPGNGTTGNPLGDIVSTEMNIPLVTPVAEKITAVLKANSVNYWVIAHGWGNNNFYIFEVTPLGVNATPVIQSIGNIHSGGIDNINSVGYMKTSPMQNKLALVNRNNTSIDVYDFNNTTGIISNEISIPMLNTVLCGIEFSMSGSYLYIENKDTLFRFTLSSSTLAGVTIDDMSVFSNSSIAIRAMQLGPDGKIYVTIRNHNYLSVISEPDAPVPQLTVDGIFLDTDGQGRKCAFGLPTLFYYKGWCNLAAPTVFPADTTTICAGENITLTSSTAFSYLWSDGSTDQSIIVADQGNYIVTISDALGCIAFSQPVTVDVLYPVIPVITSSGGQLQSTTAATYQWYCNGTEINGATQQECTPFQYGYYTVLTTDINGCTATSPPFGYLGNTCELYLKEKFTILHENEYGGFIALLPVNTHNIRIYDITGKLLLSQNADGKKQIEFCLPNHGIYFIQIESDDFSFMRKFIVN